METNKLIIALIGGIYVMEANRCYLHLEELIYKMLCQGPGRFCAGGGWVRWEWEMLEICRALWHI